MSDKKDYQVPEGLVYPCDVWKDRMACELPHQHLITLLQPVVQDETIVAELAFIYPVDEREQQHRFRHNHLPILLRLSYILNPASVVGITRLVVVELQCPVQ